MMISNNYGFSLMIRTLHFCNGGATFFGFSDSSPKNFTSFLDLCVFHLPDPMHDDALMLYRTY